MTDSNVSEITALRSRLARQEALLEFLYFHLDMAFVFEAAASNDEVMAYLSKGDLISAIKAHRNQLNAKRTDDANMDSEIGGSHDVNRQ